VGNGLQDKLRSSRASEPVPEESKLEPERHELVDGVPMRALASTTFDPTVNAVQVECVLGGVLMTIQFGKGTNPAEVPAMLRAWDANVKVRDAFPARGFGGGNRETKLARALVINARFNADGGKFIDVTGRCGDDELSIGVGKQKGDDFIKALHDIGRLSERNLAKLDTAAEAKKGTPCVVVLSDAEQFGVKYWSSDDGKAWFDSAVAEAPAEVSTDA
jgi:hypothetical protein